MSLKPLSSLKDRLRAVMAGGGLSDILGEGEPGQAAHSERMLAQQTLDSIGDAIIRTDADSRVTYLNDVAEVLVGWTRGEAEGQPITEVMQLVNASTREPIPNPILEAIARNRSVDLAPNAALLRRDGSETAVEDRASPIHGPDGVVIGGVIVLHDVTVARALALKLAYGVQYDSLTDLPNRVLLNDRLRQAIARASRNRQKLAVLFIDLDHFKEINDSLGHAIGDRVLLSVAQRLIACVRSSDTVCRRGGDEFVILLPEVAHAQDAGQTADKALAALAEPHHVDGHDLQVTASIGVGIYPEDGEDAETLMLHADVAMYAAKNEGRNAYRFFTRDMNERAAERQAIENGLRTALERQEFRVVYQPKVNLSTGAIVGVEALVRWDSPERGLMIPARFIQIAEESGLIVPIGRWVLREACRQTRVWQDAGLPPIRMAVNISAMDLRAEGFVADLRNILEDTGLAPRFLELELSEDFLMADAMSAENVNQEIKEAGVQLALDNFGNGFSSLGHLKRFRIDTLKIAQSFVGQMVTNTDDASIVNAVISMGRSLNLRVVAEGVETLEQLAFLREQGCPEGQGHYFGKAVSADRFSKLLKRGITRVPGPRESAQYGASN